MTAGAAAAAIPSTQGAAASGIGGASFGRAVTTTGGARDLGSAEVTSTDVGGGRREININFFVEGSIVSPREFIHEAIEEMRDQITEGATLLVEGA